MDGYKELDASSGYKEYPGEYPTAEYPSGRRSQDYHATDYRTVDPESQALLPTANPAVHHHIASPSALSWLRSQYPTRLPVFLAYFAGVLTCVLVQLLVCSHHWFDHSNAHESPSATVLDHLVPPYVGSTEVHKFPPASPTNAFPSLFPTSVGHAGPTPTGAEPALVATAPAYPLHTGAPHLISPFAVQRNSTRQEDQFDIFKHWGNLAPWFSVEPGAFGLDASPEAPDTCRVTGLHLLHRHGARYPTGWVVDVLVYPPSSTCIVLRLRGEDIIYHYELHASVYLLGQVLISSSIASYGGPANFSSRLHEAAAGWNASGELEFMNEWTYKLGEEILTPFGRQQLFDLGVSMRMKYGYLLKNFTESNTLPVFRTESQDRMLASALNFAIGFFGFPFEGQYQQSVTIEDPGFNNTLAPYKTCPNANVRSKSDRALPYVRQWAEIYLAAAHQRLRPLMKGYDLSVEDVYTFQQMCAYETVAIGYSKFCELFTEEEWKGFNYAMDLYFWYNSAFGSPVARVQGIGYIQELVARLTHTPIAVHNSSTNATLDDSETTFPLGQSLYVDATHEVVVLNVITALNLTNFAVDGPLPADRMPPHRAFKASHLAPFATNIQFQLLSCASLPEPQIRIIINDGVVPLTGIRGCPKQEDGMCTLDTFIRAQREIIRETDWEWACHGDWEVPSGMAWNTTTGYPPARE
ncbi:3-phytase A [Grifola frondosa]|uniref:3-phytase A n=1 Tax=Grifola frondosa TaxID=5627 RepID=A0A1C7LNU5_GRIFR|nr:3-phytase A [Grifola frondosa]